MPPPSTKYIKKLTTNDISVLTQLLRPPYDNNTIPPSQINLPSTLLRPTSLLPRLFHTLSPTQKAILCPSHLHLHPHLLRRLFLQLTQECTTHLTRLKTHPLLPSPIFTFLKRMYTINSLWMSSELYRSTYRVMPSEKRYQRVESGCEACILVFVGGNKVILRDLRASMLGRRRKERELPRLLRVVEGWIGWLDEEVSEVVMNESDALGKEIREVRRQMQLARRQERRNEREGIYDLKPLLDEWKARSGEVLEEEKEAEEERDLENEIVDEYIYLFGKNPAEQKTQSEDIHPAFRESLAFDSVSGTFFRKGEHQRQASAAGTVFPTVLLHTTQPQQTESNPGLREPSSVYSDYAYSAEEDSVHAGCRAEGELIEEYQNLLPKQNNI